MFDQGIVLQIAPTGQRNTQISLSYSPDIWLKHGLSIVGGRDGNNWSAFPVDKC